MDHPVADPLTYLAGTWLIRRTIRDHAAGRTGTFQGTATIRPHADGLHWEERGTVHIGDHRGPAGRVLYVVPGADGWEVRFDDGRPFHPLDLRTGACAVVHLCGRDRYEGTYRAHTAHEMSVTWRIHGPAKDLELIGSYAAPAVGLSSTEKSG